MTDPDPSDPQALPFLQACETYAAACQFFWEHLKDGPTAAAPMPLTFLGPWKAFAANLGMRPGVAAGEHFEVEDMFAKFLPALGYSREYQEIVRRMFDLSVQFQRRCADFAQQGVDIGLSAMQSLRKRRTSDQTILETPSALYEAWIESAEEAYSQAAHSVEFAGLLSDICNILSAFKIERGKLLEAVARHLDWPSRAEVDSLHLRVRDLAAAAKESAARGKTPRARKRAGK